MLLQKFTEKKSKRALYAGLVIIFVTSKRRLFIFVTSLNQRGEMRRDKKTPNSQGRSIKIEKIKKKKNLFLVFPIGLFS